jgi:ribA/ribD-fused uncharacterized protein
MGLITITAAERDALLSGAEITVSDDGGEILLSALGLDAAGMEALQKLGRREGETVILLARASDPQLEENEAMWIEVALDRPEREERGERGRGGRSKKVTSGTDATTSPGQQSSPQPVDTAFDSNAAPVGRNPLAIGSFSEQHRFLSNFWDTPVVYEGIRYPTVEHAYVAAKTTDAELRREVAQLATPGKAKRFGRKKIQEDENWKQIKFQVMEELTRQKYAHAHLAEKLLATGDVLIEEGNPWHDQTWGNCTCNNKSGEHPECLQPGENRLGKLLTQIRSELGDK